MTNKQPEALRLAEHLEQFRSFPDDLAAAKELRRQHARIVELEAEKVKNDRERRFAVAEALGLGNANYAWSYLNDQIKTLVKCEEELIALRKQAAAQQAVPAQCQNINEPRGCWRVACKLGGKCRKPERSATQPAAQWMDAQLVAFIEKVRDFKAQAVRVGSSDGHVRWDIEYGHYGAEVRAKTLPDAIAKAIAAQAKQ